MVLGDEHTRYLFTFLVGLAAIMLVGVVLETSAWVLVALRASWSPRSRRRGGCSAAPAGRALVPVLQDVGVAELVYATGIFLALVTA